MKIQRIPFSNIPQLSKRDKVYNNGSSKLSAFYQYPVSLEAFQDVLKARAEYPVDRQLLYDVLSDQYSRRDADESVNQNLAALQKENCFTLITAHQPSLFTGPLYFIYKIISTINLAEKLKQHYPDFHFVPVFVSGGEDHDFEEINHIHLFGKRLEWKNDEKGAVGEMGTATLLPVLKELREIVGISDIANTIYQLIEKTHIEQKEYGEAVRDLLHLLFKGKGLIVANMNDARLKRLFVNIMKTELTEQRSKVLIESTVDELSEIGFKQQATARDINLFYLKDQIRERIVLEDGIYSVLNTDYRFSEKEILAEVTEHPENFSPNVILRPLYQELIFPNLAYIGGGGELAYWMERLRQFRHFNIHYPMLIRRNSVLWIDRANSKKLQKLGLSAPQLFEDTDQIIKEFIIENTDETLNFEKEKQQLEALFDTVCEKTEKVDPTLVNTMRAEQTRQIKSLEQLENRVMRVEKQRHENAINKIRSLKEKLFPENGLQERYDNFLGLYLNYGQQFFDVLFEELDPLEKGFIVIEDDASEKGE